MANPTWPSTLPDPLARNPYFEPAFDNILKSPMDSGAIKRRPRSTSVSKVVQASFSLDADQCATLDTFVETTLGYSGPFDWRDVRSGVTKTYGFITTPTYTPIGGRLWRASFELIEA